MTGRGSVEGAVDDAGAAGVDVEVTVGAPGAEDPGERIPTGLTAYCCPPAIGAKEPDDAAGSAPTASGEDAGPVEPHIEGGGAGGACPGGSCR